MGLQPLINALLGLENEPPASNEWYWAKREEEYQDMYNRFVVEDSVIDLTWDVVVWISLSWSQAPCKLERIRYEYEKIIPGAHGKDMFLEVTYRRQSQEDFPHAAFYLYSVPNWIIYFIDFRDTDEYTKCIIRMCRKEDVKEDAI